MSEERSRAPSGGAEDEEIPRISTPEDEVEDVDSQATEDIPEGSRVVIPHLLEEVSPTAEGGPVRRPRVPDPEEHPWSDLLLATGRPPSPESMQYAESRLKAGRGPTASFPHYNPLNPGAAPPAQSSMDLLHEDTSSTVPLESQLVRRKAFRQAPADPVEQQGPFRTKEDERRIRARLRLATIAGKLEEVSPRLHHAMQLLDAFLEARSKLPEEVRSAGQELGDKAMRLRNEAHKLNQISETLHPRMEGLLAKHGLSCDAAKQGLGLCDVILDQAATRRMGEMDVMAVISAAGVAEKLIEDIETLVQDIKPVGEFCRPGGPLEELMDDAETFYDRNYEEVDDEEEEVEEGEEEGEGEEEEEEDDE